MGCSVVGGNNGADVVRCAAVEASVRGAATGELQPFSTSTIGMGFDYALASFGWSPDWGDSPKIQATISRGRFLAVPA
ncbi:MAG: hypothetical protein MUE46_12910 [Xanthomonadales bacterium]|jgi:hypothetical protein|nr:hypothetical protein [Xanthomonadales bacterium]